MTFSYLNGPIECRRNKLRQISNILILINMQSPLVELQFAFRIWHWACHQHCWIFRYIAPQQWQIVKWTLLKRALCNIPLCGVPNRKKSIKRKRKKRKRDARARYQRFQCKCIGHKIRRKRQNLLSQMRAKKKEPGTFPSNRMEQRAGRCWG